jgi:hypothetical protein
MANVTAMDTWGEWMLGDLPEVFSMTIELLGPSQQVEWIALVPPTRPDAVPHVAVFVSSKDQVAGLRREIETGAYVADFSDDATDTGWVAQIAGQSLQVEVGQVRP